MGVGLRTHLAADIPHGHWVEVAGINSGTGRIDPTQLTFAEADQRRCLLSRQFERPLFGKRYHLIVFIYKRRLTVFKNCECIITNTDTLIYSFGKGEFRNALNDFFVHSFVHSFDRPFVRLFVRFTVSLRRRNFNAQNEFQALSDTEGDRVV